MKRSGRVAGKVPRRSVARSDGVASQGSKAVAGKTILITGGTGSFGNRVAAHLAAFEPRRIIIYSRDEKKQWEMQQRFSEFSYMIGDVRDPGRLREAMRGVDLVFHAAALKQVPSCETYPYEALQTNTIGSHNVCEAALRAGVQTVVALSTDKAVKPVNAMGMSKALMEKIVCSRNQAALDTRFCCVRYGNVMGSRGSVIPLFRKQIESGGPVTLTVPQMTRFLMTLDESVDLVVHAMANAKGGEIFVRKAPAATVEDLARALIMKYGNGVDIPVRVIGIRPGEKVDEVLVNEYEVQRAVETDDYFTIHPEYRGPAIASRYPVGYEYTSANTRRVSRPEEIGALLDRVGLVEYYI
jgi:UDP-N-acetylglucosamine 4,6-dehydratase/5-epimerase